VGYCPTKSGNETLSLFSFAIIGPGPKYNFLGKIAETLKTHSASLLKKWTRSSEEKVQTNKEVSGLSRGQFYCSGGFITPSQILCFVYGCFVKQA
jgi:hypothetical protein